MTQEEIPFAEALMNLPPYVEVSVEKIVNAPTNYSTGGMTRVFTPDVVLHCDNPICSGSRVFRSNNDVETSGPGKWTYVALIYKCSNCNINTKIYSVAINISSGSSNDGKIIKIGELPTFGPPIPTRAMSLVGPARDLFLKGRRAEHQGLGIAAFVYYRRIVEDQWQRLVGEIIKVAKRTQGDETLVALLERAKIETQFSKAVLMIGDAIPNSIKLNGYNPLTLLYGPLSEGVHSKTDEECLELAQAIRTVIYELAEKISSALKEHSELESAITKLMNRNAARTEAKASTSTEENPPPDSAKEESSA